MKKIFSLSLIMMICLALVGCTTSHKSNVNKDEFVAKAVEQSSMIQSASFEMETEVTVPGATDQLKIKLSADVSPEAQHITMKLPTGEDENLEFYLNQEFAYINIGEGWVKAPAEMATALAGNTPSTANISAATEIVKKFLNDAMIEETSTGYTVSFNLTKENFTEFLSTLNTGEIGNAFDEVNFKKAEYVFNYNRDYQVVGSNAHFILEGPDKTVAQFKTKMTVDKMNQVTVTIPQEIINSASEMPQ